LAWNRTILCTLGDLDDLGDLRMDNVVFLVMLCYSKLGESESEFKLMTSGYQEFRIVNKKDQYLLVRE
jgi:hypothetical protein